MRESVRTFRLRTASKKLVSNLPELLSLNGIMVLVSAVKLQELEETMITLFSE